MGMTGDAGGCILSHFSGSVRNAIIYGHRSAR